MTTAHPTKTPTAHKPERFAYDRLFQVRILRTLFQDPEFTLAVGSKLSFQHFERRAVRWVAQKILDYAKKHNHGISKDALQIMFDRDLKTGRLLEESKREAKKVIDLIERPVKDRSFIKEEVHGFVKNQVVRTAIMRSLDHLEAHDFEAIDKEFTEVLEVQEVLTGGLGHFYVRDVKTRSAVRARYEKNGVSTGLKLDDYLKPGGLPPKALGCVIAPTGKGKSHCLVHLGRSAIIESSAKVLHVTLELAEEAVLDRYDAAFSGIAINHLESRTDDVERIVDDYGARYGEFLVVKEFPPATLTAAALRAYVRQLERAAFYPDIIMLDYADDMVPSMVSRDHDAYSDMGQIYRELRKLAFELQIPIWTASQTQRNALNKEMIDLDSIADSFKKAMIADVVICLCQTKEETTKKTARFFVAKNRLGSDKFEFKVSLDWSRSTIKS